MGIGGALHYSAYIKFLQNPKFKNIFQWLSTNFPGMAYKRWEEGQGGERREEVGRGEKEYFKGKTDTDHMRFHPAPTLPSVHIS